MTGQIPDQTIDPDGELDLPAPPPSRVRGLLLSIAAAGLGLSSALAFHALSGVDSLLMPALAVVLLTAGPVGTGWIAWRHTLRDAWREITFRCVDEVVLAILRILGLTAMMLYAAGIMALSPVPEVQRLEAAMLVLQAGSLGGWIILLDLLRRRQACLKRRIGAACADLVCVTALLCLGGPPMQVWMFCYLGIALASGLGDGRTGLILTSAGGVAGLAVVAAFTGVLSETPFLIVGVGVGLLLLPAQSIFLAGSGLGRTIGPPKRRFRILLARTADSGCAAFAGCSNVPDTRYSSPRTETRPLTCCTRAASTSCCSTYNCEIPMPSTSSACTVSCARRTRICRSWGWCPG